MNCRDYLDLFVKRREQASGAGQARAVTWVLSMECADELSPGGAPHACLALAALLGAGRIPESVFAADAVAEIAAAPVTVRSCGPSAADKTAAHPALARPRHDSV